MDKNAAALPSLVKLQSQEALQAQNNALVPVLTSGLKARGWKLAVAESCTGGLLAGYVTRPAGSSAWFDCGVVAYANEIKERVLQVPVQYMIEHGSVSEPVARSMALGVQRLSGSQIAVGVTGIAGPTGGTDKKPVGTVCFGFAVLPDATQAVNSFSRVMHFAGDREQVRQQAVQYVFNELIAMITSTPLAPR
jgi:nicotinamide-nucleotide amidase